MNTKAWTPHYPPLSDQPNRWSKPHTIITPFYFEGHVEYCWTARAAGRHAVGFEQSLEVAQRRAETWIASVWALVKAGEQHG